MYNSLRLEDILKLVEFGLRALWRILIEGLVFFRVDSASVKWTHC